MISSPARAGKEQARIGAVPAVQAVAGIFLLLSFGVFALVIINIGTHPAIFTGTRDPGEIVWNFLRAVGIVRPLAMMVGAALLFWLAIQLSLRRVGAMRWARVVLMWGIVIAAMGFLQSLTTPAREAAPLLGVLLVMCGGTYYALSQTRHLYIGDEDNAQQATRMAWNLLMPTLIVFAVIAITPLEQVFITSLTDERFASSDEAVFVGLENYAELLGIRIDMLSCERDPATSACLTEIGRDGVTATVYPRPRDVLDESYRELRFRDVSTFTLFGERFIISVRDRDFFNAAVTTVIYTVIAGGLQLIFGLGIALILSTQLRGGSILRLALLVPLAIPTLIATQFWTVIFQEDASGLANSVLMGLGIIENPNIWLLDPTWQLPAVILVIVWKETPAMALLLLPGVLSIPKEVYQAAHVDGASRWQQFWLITLPILRPTIGVALILRTMVLLRVFDLFDILLGRTRYSMATYAYDQLILQQKLGYSSAVSVTIFAIIFVFTVVYMRTLKIDKT